MHILHFVIPIRNILILPWNPKKEKDGPLWLWERTGGGRSSWVQFDPTMKAACADFVKMALESFENAQIPVWFLKEPNGFVGAAIHPSEGKDCFTPVREKLPDRSAFCCMPRFLLQNADEKTDAVCRRIGREVYGVFASRDYEPEPLFWYTESIGDNVYFCADCGKPVTDRTLPEPAKQLESGKRNGDRICCSGCDWKRNPPAWATGNL